MPRTTIVPLTILGPYPATLPVAANALDAVLTAADITNLNQTAFNGPKLLMFRNSHATIAYTVTITSKADNRNRLGDITAFTLQAGDIGFFRIDTAEGWMQADGMLYFQGSDATILFGVINL